MYFWINFFLWVLGILWVGIFFALGLEPRWKKTSRGALSIGFTLLSLTPAYLKIKLTGTPWLDLMFWVSIATLLLYIFIPFKDKLWKKMLLFVLFITVTYISEILCKFLAGFAGIPFDSSFNSPEMVMMVAGDTAILLIFSALLLIIWNRFIVHKATTRRILIFFVFPLSQLITMYALDSSLPLEDSPGGFLAGIGIVLGFFADFILLYIMMEQGEKEALAKQLQELESLYQVENVHYQSIEARRNEMAKLRHDFNNQLITVYHLAEQGELQQVRALLDGIQTDVAGTIEYNYCGNSVVNAVLDEKAAVCLARGISLKTELDMGEEPAIQPVHLCSIFSNLMDNAIRAADQLPEAERFITVKASRKEDYLHIKVENSALEEKKGNSRQRKGYGQEILRDIAFRYSGEFLTDWKNGVYRAMLSLTITE